MNPSMVVDVGNSRVKWGRCADGRVAEAASLPLDDPAAWSEQLHRWGATGPHAWAVGGVQPVRRDGLVAWLRQRGDAVCVLDDWRQLPLEVRVPAPERVGIDRLFNAVAARERMRPGVPAVVVDAGSAVTVDWLDEAGAFCGGAIFPGLRLMAEALHAHTALLPRVEVPTGNPLVPGPSTRAAIEAGIYWAVAGGVQRLVAQLASQARAAPDVILTGGDAALLHPALDANVVLWPLMTLEGIRRTAASLEGDKETG